MLITLSFGTGTSLAQTCNCCTASPQLSLPTSPPQVCIPPSFNATVDAAGDLPGPGAVAVPGQTQFLP